MHPLMVKSKTTEVRQIQVVNATPMDKILNLCTGSGLVMNNYNAGVLKDAIFAENCTGYRTDIVINSGVLLIIVQFHSSVTPTTLPHGYDLVQPVPVVIFELPIYFPHSDDKEIHF